MIAKSRKECFVVRPADRLERAGIDLLRADAPPNSRKYVAFAPQSAVAASHRREGYIQDSNRGTASTRDSTFGQRAPYVRECSGDCEGMERFKNPLPSDCDLVFVWVSHLVPVQTLERVWWE